MKAISQRAKKVMDVLIEGMDNETNDHKQIDNSKGTFMTKIKRICKQCNEEFWINKSTAERGKGIFCSRKCYLLWKSQHTKREKCNAWKGGKITRICQTCGKEFQIYPSRTKQGRGIFCSQYCYQKWWGENIKGQNGLRWKGGKTKRICQYCGEEFEAFPSQIRRGRGLFCSHSCRRKAEKIPKHHTKPELIFEEICKKHDLPYKYTGDGSFWIGNKPSINPDFIECNGKKIAVEVFSYWHDPIRRFGKVRYSATYEGRKKILKKYGWELVVFWQEDLEREDAEQFLLNKLQKEGVI